MDSNYFVDFNRQNAVFLSFWGTKNQIWTKSENLNIQDGDYLWRYLFDYRCHENPWDTTWFCLIESASEAYYMYQISCQSDELCRK